MTLQVVGAGLPRTATSSLNRALEHLLGGRGYHMSVIPGHPFDLGPAWQEAIAGGTPDWDALFAGYVATVDWPGSAFWRELSQANPRALVILSVRDSAEEWYQSADATILPYARLALAPDWSQGHDFTALLERLVGGKQWNDPVTLMTAYDRHNAAVRQSVPAHRLLEWRAADGWEPICRALNRPVPDLPFPWVNRRSEWR
jgi:hypothetical protein